MSLIAVLRLATLIVRILLAVVCLYMVCRTDWTGSRKRAWLVVGIAAVVFAASTAAGEILYLGWIGDNRAFGTDALRYSIYHFGYLSNAMVAAALPLLLAGILATGRGVGVFAVLTSLAVFGYASFAVFSGMFQDWDSLMEIARVLGFVAIIGNLLVWILVVLRKAEIDIYLAGFLVIETLFLLLVPIQEAFFQFAGLDGAREMWGLHQFVQLVACSAQFAIVVAVLRLSARGSVLPRLRLGGAL